MLTQKRKEILNQLIEIDKISTENNWDYQEAFEYHNLAQIKRCSQNDTAIDKKANQLWDQLLKSYKVDMKNKLPQEVDDYYSNGVNNNHYDRFNRYENDMRRLGILR